MSAWIVSKRHIDALVTGLLQKNITSGDPTELGRQLWQENLHSIHYRYPDTLETDSNYPGPNDFKAASVQAYRYEPYPLAPANLHQQACCYRYQSCEHPGWPHSQACAWITRLIDMLPKAASNDVFPWGLD